MNSISLVGNICNDLELRTTNTGKSVLTFNIAVKRPHTKDTTDFIPLVVWEQSAEYLSRYARKGTKIAVCGKLTARQYEDKEGKKRTAYEVICDSVEICESRDKTDDNAPTFTPPANPKWEEVKDDDNLPF